MSLPSLFDLSGQRILVTGAASGIGLAISEAMLEAGAEVIMSTSTPNCSESAEPIAAPLLEGQRVAAGCQRYRCGGRPGGCAGGAAWRHRLRVCQCGHERRPRFLGGSRSPGER